MELAEEDIIHKDLSKMKVQPNMKDYDEAYKTFKWEDVEKEFSWHKTGKVNIAHEAVDRHAQSDKKDKTALIYVGDEEERKLTFGELSKESNKFANFLKKVGIKKGDRVFIFMPRSPELYIGFLGIVKIGAIAGPLFEAFMEGAVKDRLQDSSAAAIITIPSMRERIPIDVLPDLKHIIYVGEGEAGDESKFHKLPLGHVKEWSYEKEMAEASEEHETEWMDREDPMLLHYTSGSTGKPKGVVHVHNAMIGHLQTGRWLLDLHEDDIYWCTADPGWVTGTSYGIFAPWLNGVTEVIRGGRFSVDKWYKTIEKHKVSVWYSAPTAFRFIMAAKEQPKDYDLSSLRQIFSVGEPLNPEVVKWGMEEFNLAIHDNWWMTETGMQLISNYASMDVRPGSMGKPFPGVEATIIDDTGKEVGPDTIGNLAIKKGWPSMMRSIWHNEEKFKSYFQFDPWYMSGDSAYKDKDGYFWFQGRVDDVINTSGERVGPFEVESKLVEHPAVAEAGVIGKPDHLRGNIIKAFVSLVPGTKPSDELKEEIRVFVKTGLAAHAAPREIEFMDKLPKTRSGKIMRRVLKAKELGLPVGDLSTIDDD